MSLLRQWQLLDALMPALLVLRPVERILAWNVGAVDDALAVTLAFLSHHSERAAQLLMFHSGAPVARRPLEWGLSDLRGVPREPWLEPVEGKRSRWAPRREVLESVVLGRPSGPVDLLIADLASGGPGGSARDAGASLRQGGLLLLSHPAPRAAPPSSEWEAADCTGRLYRKLTPSATPAGGPRPDSDHAPVTLARHHERAVLVESYTHLARSLAHRFAYRGERAEDLEQVALLALVKAADRYDPERGRPFGAFATACITGEIKRHFRDKTWMVRVPRSVQEMHLAIRAARDDLTQVNGSSPTIAQIAAHLRTTEESVLAAMEAATNSWATSLDVPSPDGEGPAVEIPVTEAGFEHSLDRGLLKESITHLSPAERLILKRVYFDGCSQRQVAEELHVSQMHISRLMAKALARMRQTFQPA